jgi:hypothetical protein
MFFNEARGRRAVSILAVGVVLTASALPSVYALFRCRMSGEFEATPCCGHKESAEAEGRASVRAAPCCEKVTFRVEHLPGAESSAPRLQVAVVGLMAAALGAPPSPRGALAGEWNRRPIASCAGPPIFLQTCSLLI